VGFINDDGSAGDSNENFLGEVSSGGQAINSKDEILGKVNLGNAEISDANGGHFCTISSAGELTDSIDSHKGKFDNFTFHKIRMAVAYIFFFDGALIDPRRPSKITIEETEEEQSLSIRSPSSAPTPSDEKQEETLTLELPPPKNLGQKAEIPTENESVTLSLNFPPKKREIENRQYKTYKVGDFKNIENGKKNLLEITSCDCPVEQIAVRLEKGGKEVVFQRTTLTGDNKKTQVQRFALPYPLTLDRISAEYSEHTEEGKLILTMTKPVVTAAAGAINAEFTKFTIPATPSASPDSKISVKAGQSSAYFQFEIQGNSVHETEVIGELAGGENLRFHTVTTIESEGVQKKATQTFTLPFKVTVDHIECIDGGKLVKVHSKSFQQSTTSATELEQLDVTVPIKNL